VRGIVHPCGAGFLGESGQHNESLKCDAGRGSQFLALRATWGSPLV